MLMLSSPSNLL